MIARPRVLADERAAFLDGPVPALPGLDRVRASVRAAGGDEGVLLRALASGAAAAEHEQDRDLIAWSAWRAGVLGIRGDALDRLERAVDDGRGAVAAAALGLRADTIAAFARRQRTDRFWWPDRADDSGYVLAVGGFAGFGGAWIRPADRGIPLGDGAFAVQVAGEWWRLDGDVFGAVLRRAADQDALAAQAVHAAAGVQDDPAAAVLVLRPDTHLAWIYVAEPA